MARTGENIYKRKDGRWEARYIDSYNAEGKAKYRSVYGKSYQEVREKRQLLIHRKMLGENPCMSYTSLFHDLAQNWLNSTKLRVKESTFARYNNQVKKYIVPYFGKYHVSKISTEQIERFISRLIASREEGGHGLSPKTVEDILILMKNMMKFGKCYTHLDLYRIKIKKAEKKPRVLSKSEQVRLHLYLQNSTDLIGAGILLSMHTGIRIGELCALSWDDIQLNEQTINICKTLQRIQTDNHADGKTKIIITPPKTKKSIRSIPIPSFLLLTLCKMKGNAGEYLLTGCNKPMEPRTLQNHFKKCLINCGIPDYNFHALRHTFATNYIEAGFDARSLSQILGHASVKITLELYVHASDTLKRTNIEKLIEIAYSPSKIPSPERKSS